MNKFEREVARSQLMSEREALEQLEKIYKQAADEICRKLEISNGKISILLNEIENADEKTLSILQSQIYQRNFQQNIKKQLDFLLQDLNDNQYAGISEYIKNSYDNGFIGTLYNFNMSGVPINVPIDPTLVVRAIYIDSKLSKKLYDELGEDVETLKRKVSATVSRGIASNMHYNDIARNIANNSKTGLNNAMRIVRTEGNRVYNAANLDCGKAAKEKGVDDVKQWDSTLDGSTRQHHRQLDGQVRELEEDFEVNGRKAPAPLHFGIPGEDINCRCICLVKPRWDVDSAFTKIDNETGQLLEFQGVEDFEDFKKRYWKSVKKNKAKSMDIFNVDGEYSTTSITPDDIYNDLGTSAIGKETLRLLDNLPQKIKLDYKTIPSGGLRGEETNGVINIYVRNCKDVKTATCTVIHEHTHYRYGIGQSQWAESVCVAQELKHRRNRDLTISEKRTIIKAVKDVYPEFNWRKGGIINGRRKK